MGCSRGTAGGGGVEGRRLRVVDVLGVEFVGFQSRAAESRWLGRCAVDVGARLRKGDCGKPSQLDWNPRRRRLFRRDERAAVAGVGSWSFAV